MARSRTAQNVERWCSDPGEAATRPRFAYRHLLVDPQPESLDLVLGPWWWSRGDELGDVVEPDRVGAGAEERHDVGVRHVVVPRERHVARSRPTTMYVTLGSDGSPSNGVWLLMNRRWVCASRSATTDSRSLVSISSHGEIWSSDRSKVGVWNTRSAQIICIQVVPHFAGVLMMMSSGRRTKPSNRLFSLVMDV